MTDHSVRPNARATSLGDARDLRNLLEAVTDVLTLPFDTPGYEWQLADRAGWVLAVVQGALTENPEDIGWNADYLRGRFPAKQVAEAGEGQ